MILLLIRVLCAAVLAYLAGKLVACIKLPSILGWLIAGMVLGPNALSCAFTGEQQRAGGCMVPKRYAHFGMCSRADDWHRACLE